MNSNSQSRSVTTVLLLAVLALAAPVARAQEEAEEDEGKKLGSVRVEIEEWVSQPAGLEYNSATVRDPDQPFSTRLVGPTHGTESDLRYRLLYQLPKKFGTIVGTYYVHHAETDMRVFSPGSFVYDEHLIHSLFAGVANDGLSDGFTADTYTKLRDTRLDFVRPAFRSARASAEWSIGWRRVSHDRNHNATYFALVPDLPSLIPPLVDCDSECPDLSPTEDFASITSQYDGRGPTLGIDVDFPLWRDKVVFEGGLDFTVLRGKIDADYRSFNNFYVLDMQSESIILQPPYAEFAYFTDPTASTLCETPDADVNGDGVLDCTNDPEPASKFIREIEARHGFQTESRSTTSDVLEINLGFRWHALKWLDVTGGFRSARYTGVGVDLVPKANTFEPGDSFRPENQIVINVDEVDEIDRSVTYEGFYFGLNFRIF